MTTTNMFLRILFSCGIIALTTASVVSDHPCNRACEVNRPMTCEYNFTVENYFVLSRACYNCPFNYTDCFRPHCVSTNGMPRHLLTVNRQMPGPSIEVCKDDKVIVWVHNKIDDGSSTSIHWHGMTQTNTNFMDGVPRLTQCSIQPFELFRYEFIADNAGTHWWHSHSGVQLGDGLHGALIVREPASRDPSRSLYDFDRSDHIMVITDWAERPVIFRYMEEMQHRWVTPKMLKVLVNGRGRKYEVTDHVIKGDATTSGYTPYEVFTVSAGMRYRFRVIAAAARCFFRVMVDNHDFTVITSDGWPMTPSTVGSFMIHPGERYDFVLNANQAAGDYWIKVEAYGDCAGNNDGHGAAILHYDGYTGNTDYMPNTDVEDFTHKGTILNPASEQYTLNNTIPQGTLRYDPPGDQDEDFTEEKVGLRYYIMLRYQASDNAYYSHPEYYPNSVRWGLITPTLNNLTMYRPSVPLATQWQDAEKNFCNTSTIDTTTKCNDNLCLCTHMLDIPKGEVVELFMVGAAGDPHQMHLHGYTFRVVGEGYLADPTNKTDFLKLDLDDIKKRDAMGEIPRSLVNPWYKDTVTVQARGGYVIVRFKADNPGVWFFHCHNEGHLMQGMAMVMKVGDPEDFPKAPKYHPKCGGYSYYKNKYEDKCEDGNGNGETSGCAQNFVNMLLLTVLVIIQKCCEF
ncbi:uncharacterized protein LOC123549187 isoform X1 [Mercenaria mercenaria]|uniref:uncharacterized protein LOC123549187 isoform X1 n=1 Tax=Mercenaria mercenaria TaxID=6596 RepID=UPI00234E839F|nr:uncharacterized protein LOC123549187 isoform X1 [Mercenaria mercenaria]